MVWVIHIPKKNNVRFIWNVSKVLHIFAKQLTTHTMKNTQISKSSKMYNRLFDHCQKQYKNVKEIQKAYIQNNQVYAIEYLTTCGIVSIPSATYDSDKVIVFN